MNCTECGKHIEKSYAGMCQGCYLYFHRGGMVHPLPPNGRIEHDASGKVICHICGRSYTRLGSHIKESHGMNIAEYKAQFGLCANARTTELNYSNKMRCNSYKHNMPERLMEAGKLTRIQTGDKTLRKGKPVRLQECLDRSDRYRKKK